MNDLTVTVNKKINAPIEKVFDAWLNPAMLAKFILPMPGMPEPETSNDAKVGGEFSIIMQVGENKIPHTGEYLIIERPNKLSFTWVSPFAADNSVVTIDFVSQGASTTQVELTHVKFNDEESRANHEGGWGNILDALNAVLS